MLAEGREAGLVGRASGRVARRVLGTVAEHYTPATGMEEIAIWRAAHGGSLDPLVQAIRDCSFLSRRVALLKTLVKAVPEGDELPASLLRDPSSAGRPARGKTGPQARGGEPGGGRLADGRKRPGMLEIGGPDAVREQLGELPRSQREDVVRAVRDSGYPARETLEDFRVLVAEPILGAPSRPRTVRNAPGGVPPGKTPRSLTTRTRPRADRASPRCAAGPGTAPGPSHLCTERQLGSCPANCSLH